MAAVVEAAAADGGPVHLPGQGHEAMLSAPELFAREVTQFLARL